jgi:thiosulfate/3-mercaptopyruvate sulfurtransferase
MQLMSQKVLIFKVLFGIEIPKNHLVDTQWLLKNLDNPKLKIVDTREKKEYDAGHLKNAINVPKSAYFQGFMGSDIKKLYNTPEQMTAIFQNSGITQTDTVLFYSAGIKDEDFGDSASGLWNAWVYGFENSVILNGGYAKWIYENKPTTIEVPTVTKSDFEFSSYKKGTLSNISDILDAIYDENIQISDARVSKAYLGNDTNKELARFGRIPTAKLTPVVRQVKFVNEKYYEIINQEEAIKALTNNGFGIELDKPLITYCNTGHKARGLWFVAKFIANMKDVSVYDGGILEYSRTNHKMETGEPTE